MDEEEMNAEEILRRAYKWYGVKAPTNYTFKIRDDYVKTMKEYSAWVRKDKIDNAEWWETWKIN
tara:strand:- start:1167 stop:1358 length:192 start_codon:yes stop_codon:yes gene_type:complete